MNERHPDIWEVPYLAYRSVGCVGAAITSPSCASTASPARAVWPLLWISISDYKLPKEMHKDFADEIQKISEKQGEVAPEQIMAAFRGGKGHPGERASRISAG